MTVVGVTVSSSAGVVGRFKHSLVVEDERRVMEVRKRTVSQEPSKRMAAMVMAFLAALEESEGTVGPQWMTGELADCGFHYQSSKRT